MNGAFLILLIKICAIVQGISATEPKSTDIQIVEKNKIENKLKFKKADNFKYISIKGIQQGPRQCVSTCTSMILAEMGIKMSADKIEMLTCGKIGTAPALSRIVNALEKNQIQLVMARYETKNGNIDLISEYIIELLKKNTPSAVLKKRHMQVCVGYDGQQEVLYFLDPLKPDKIFIKPKDKFSQELESSPEIHSSGKIFLLHKKTDLEKFVLLQRQGREISQSFLPNIQKGEEDL